MQKLSKSEYLEKAKQHAIIKGGECLSDEYLNSETHLEWKCHNEKHSSWFSIKYSVMKMGTWCPQCAIDKSTLDRTNVNGLEIAKSHAIQKGGQCLSSEYLGARHKLSWKCSEVTHSSWEATYTNVMSYNKWCPECAGFHSPEKLLIKAYDYAKKKNGYCISIACNDTSTQKLEWKCKEPKHGIWKTTLGAVMRGSWCTDCGLEKNKITNLLKDGLKKCQDLAILKGGVCLSNRYQGNVKKLLWKCNNPSHPSWENSYISILKGKWCPICTGILTKEERLNKAQDKAASWGGKCLTDNYIKNKQKMVWKCKITDHPNWSATYANVVNHNNWCTKCSEYFYKEHKIRNILEYLLEVKLNKIKPTWNINPKTGFLLELDGYNQSLNFAFEFQGRQHYKKAFGQTEQDLEYIKFKDEVKKQNCINNHVTLLIIDDDKNTDNALTCLFYLVERLKDLKIEINKKIDFEEVKLIFNKNSSYQESFLEKAKNYAISRGGKCLSTIYTNKSSLLEWKCNNDLHKSWFRNFDLIYNKSWCSRCVKRK